MTHYLIGLDYGTESARGVLVDIETGAVVDHHAEAYPHGVMTKGLPGGEELPRSWALQDAADYEIVAERILEKIGRDRTVEGIGVGFTASTPMPATADGQPLSALQPGNPHAYVKLWKHAAAQPFADAINADGGAFLNNFGGRVSGEWLLAKAAQIAEEDPEAWGRTERFIEAGDWLVWRLTGVETRSLGFAAYKAQYGQDGYPEVFPGLSERLAAPQRIGSTAGTLSDHWRERTGILGRAEVAVAVIDSHVVLPAVGAVETGTLVGALGTSAVYLLLEKEFRPLPSGIEGVAFDGSIRDLWCYEAGQAGFGDMLAWFVRTFPKSQDASENFALYNQEAASLAPGENHLVAVDWWSGNRVPYADSSLSGMLVGLNMQTTAVGIYRALIDAVCFGARSIVEIFANDELKLDRVILTSGLALNNPFLVQTMADVLARPIDVPQISHPTSVGAAVHGAVAAGVVPDFPTGASRFGAKSFRRFEPDQGRSAAYDVLYEQYRKLSSDDAAKSAMRALHAM